MKVKIQQPKNKFAFYSVLALLLIALVVIFFLFSTKGQEIKLNKYSEVIENCVMDDTASRSLIFNCTALLNKFEFEENKEECFSLSLVTPEDKLVELSVCEKEGIVEWDKQTMINEDTIVPIYITFEYGKNLINSYSLDSILFTLVEDPEVIDIKNRLAQKGNEVSNITTQRKQELINKGYYLNPPLKVVEGKEFERITFYMGDIESVSKEGELITIDLKINIGGKDYETTFEVKSFSYMKSWDFEKVTSSNIDSYTIEGEHQIVLLYLDSESNIGIDDIRQFCLQEDKYFDAVPVCNNIEGLSLDSLKIDDIDNYVKNIDKQSTDGFLQFDDFVFGYLLKK